MFMEIMPVPTLDYADFVLPPIGGTSVPSKERNRISRILFESLLKPSSMPIHPAIYNQPELYTDRFAERIYQSITGSLRSDISAVSRVLGVDLGTVEDGGAFDVLHQDISVCHIGRSELQRSWFEAGSDSWGRRAGYNITACKLSTGVDLEGKPHNTAVFSYPVPKEESFSPFFSRITKVLYPLDRETIDAYKYEETGSDKTARLIVWHTHNTDLLSRLLIIRSFAIMFNNLGLEELGLT